MQGLQINEVSLVVLYLKLFQVPYSEVTKIFNQEALKKAL